MARLRRFAVIGDVHAEDESLAAVLDASAGTDAVLCVGDVVDGHGDADRCCAMLEDAGAIVVRGNHERWLLRSEMRSLPDATDVAQLSERSLAWLSSLPSTLELTTLEGPLLLCHAVGEDDMSRLAEDDHGYALASNDALRRVIDRGYRMMLCGHTHRPFVRRIEGLVIVNAGTLYREHAPGFTIVDLEARVAERYRIEGARVREEGRTALP